MNAKPVLLGLLAVATVVVAPSIYFRATFTPVKSAELLAFSDGRYKAVRMSLSRSSASPFCYHSVSVLPAPLPESVAESEKQYQVYFAPCAGPGELDKLTTRSLLAKQQSVVARQETRTLEKPNPAGLICFASLQ